MGRDRFELNKNLAQMLKGGVDDAAGRGSLATETRRIFGELSVFCTILTYKTLNFAAGCSRKVIERGADMLGWTLDELIMKTITALREAEKEAEL